MKLLYLNHNVAGTGTFLRALNLARAMVRRGHQVTLVTTSARHRTRLVQTERDGVVVVEAPDLWWGPARTGWDPWNALRRYLHVRRMDVDLVHAFDGRPVVSLPGRALAAEGVPLVMDWADWWGRGGQISQRSGWPVRTFFGPVETWFEEAFRNAAAAQTVISCALQERAVRLGGAPDRIMILPNGCDAERIRPLDRDMARSRLALDPSWPIAVHVGVMTTEDMGMLSDAWRLVRRRLPTARLVLVGNPRAAVPDDLRSSRAVQVTGFVEDTMKDLWLGAADACVVALPDTLGNRGRWPSKVNDYFCAARATVMPDVGDAASLVRQRGLGRATPADAAGLADGLHHALSMRDASDEAGRRARRLAETELAWPTLAAAVDSMYHDVTAAGSRPGGA